MATVDTWDPEQYERFAAERAAPFWDLLSLVRPVPGGRVVDLGCGNGELTAALHRRLEAAETLGLDSSPAMLVRAAALAGGGLRFEPGDIAAFRQGDDEHADQQGEVPLHRHTHAPRPARTDSYLVISGGGGCG